MSVGPAILSACKEIVRGISDSYRLGARAMLAAPGIIAVAIVTEFAQHIAEIHMGMFDSRASAHALAQSSLRWDFGYVKLTGFALTMFLIARYWKLDRSLSKAIKVPPVVLVRTAAAAGVLIIVGLTLNWSGKGQTKPVGVALSIISNLVQSGLLVWVIGLWLEDANISLRRALSALLPTAAVITLLFGAVMLPVQVVHGLDHKFALGQARPIVWLLMTFDAVVVGYMAAAAGSAVYIGYMLQATWRGWGRRFSETTLG